MKKNKILITLISTLTPTSLLCALSPLTSCSKSGQHIVQPTEIEKQFCPSSGSLIARYSFKFNEVVKNDTLHVAIEEKNATNLVKLVDYSCNDMICVIHVKWLGDYMPQTEALFNVTFTSGYGWKETVYDCKFIYKPSKIEPESITSTPSLTLLPSQSSKISASISPNAAFQGVTWKSSDEEIATVDNDGEVEAHKYGNVIITARSKANPNVFTTCAVTVLKTGSITINGEHNLDLGNTNQFAFYAKDIDNNDISDKCTWSFEPMDSINYSVGTFEKNIFKLSDDGKKYGGYGNVIASYVNANGENEQQMFTISLANFGYFISETDGIVGLEGGNISSKYDVDMSNKHVVTPFAYFNRRGKWITSFGTHSGSFIAQKEPIKCLCINEHIIIHNDVLLYCQVNDIIVPKYNREGFEGSEYITSRDKNGNELHCVAWMNKITKDITKISFGCQNTIILETVEEIGDGAFRNTHFANPNNINIKNVKKLGFYAFAASNVINIEFGSNIENVSSWAFHECKNLKSVKFNSTTKAIQIESNAFEWCLNLQDIVFDANTQISSIADYAFKDCISLKIIDLTNTNVVSLKDNAFKNCNSLTNVIIPSTCTHIGPNCFSGITKLCEDGNGVTFLDTDSYWDHNYGWSSMLWQPSKLNITENARMLCPQYRAIAVNKQAFNKFGNGENQYQFKDTSNNEVSVEQTSDTTEFELNTVRIPAFYSVGYSTFHPVTSLANGAFKNNKSIQTLQFGTTTNLQIIPAAGETTGAFYGCDNINTIDVSYLFELPAAWNGWDSTAFADLPATGRVLYRLGMKESIWSDFFKAHGLPSGWIFKGDDPLIPEMR